MTRLTAALLPVALFVWLWLADAAMKGFVLSLVVVLGVAVLLRRRSASVRHSVWLTGMCGLLLLPVAAVLLPSWRVLPDWLAVHETPPSDELVRLEPMLLVPDDTLEFVDLIPLKETEFVDSTELDAEDVTLGNQLELESYEPLTVIGEFDSPDESEGVEFSAVLIDSPEVAIDSRLVEWTEPSLAAVQSSEPAWHSLMWLVPVWMLGGIYMLLRLLFGQLALWRLCRGATRLDTPEWTQRVRDVCGELGIRLRGASAPVAVWKVTSRIIPLTWGILRPKVALPVDVESWDEERIRTVLLHELAHVRRRDCMTQWIAEIAHVLHWFNPLVWLAVRRMRLERERACDDMVLDRGLAPPAYADQLLKITSEYRSFGRQLPLSIAPLSLAMARRSGLEQRVRSILDSTLDRKRLTRLGLGVVLVLIAGVALPLSMLDSRPVATAEETASADEAGESEADAVAANKTEADSSKLRYTCVPKSKFIDLSGRVVVTASLHNDDDEPVTVYWGDYAYPTMYEFDIRHDESGERLAATRAAPWDTVVPPVASRQHFRTIQPSESVSYDIHLMSGPGGNSQWVDFRRPGTHTITPTLHVTTSQTLDRETGELSNVPGAWTGTVEALPFVVTVVGADAGANADLEITGVVTTATGHPAAGAIVDVTRRATDLGAAAYDGFNDVRVTQVRTDEKGQFHVVRLPEKESSYRLTAWLPGHPSGTVRVINHGRSLNKEAKITLPSGTTLSGRVVDENGHPIEAVRVSSREWTDKDGRFSLSGMPTDDHYYVNLWRPGFDDISRKISHAAATSGDLTITLPRKREVKLSGVARFPDGSPVRRSKLEFALTLPEDAHVPDPHINKVQCTTTSKGEFTITLPHALEYSAIATAFAPAKHNIGRTWRCQIERLSEGSGPLELVFENRHSLAVLIEPTNELPESLQMRVECYLEGRRMMEQRKVGAATERVEFDRLTPGEYRVQVFISSADHMNWWETVTIPAVDTPRSSTVTFKIPRLLFGGLSARFVMPDGKTPASNAVIRTYASGMSARHVTDEAGRITMRDLPIGDAWLHAQGIADVSESGQSAQVLPGVITDVGTIPLKRVDEVTGWFEGTLKYEDGSPVLGARPTGLMTGLHTNGSTWPSEYHAGPLDIDGHFRIRLPVGRHDCIFDLNGAAAWSGAIPVRTFGGFQTGLPEGFGRLAVLVDVKPGETVKRDLVLARPETSRTLVATWKPIKTQPLTATAVVETGSGIIAATKYLGRNDPQNPPTPAIFDNVPDGRVSVILRAWNESYVGVASVPADADEPAITFDPKEKSTLLVRVFGPDGEPLRGLGLGVRTHIARRNVGVCVVPPVPVGRNQRSGPKHPMFDELDDGTMVVRGLGRAFYSVKISSHDWLLEETVPLMQGAGATLERHVDENGHRIRKSAKLPIDELLDDLRSGDPVRQTRGMYYFEEGRTQSAEAARLLVPLLANRDNRKWWVHQYAETTNRGSAVAEHARQTLPVMGKSAVPALIAGLSSDSSDIRSASAGILRSIPDQRAVAPLLKLFGDSDAAVRRAAAHALQTQGEAAVEPVLLALQDDSAQTRNLALQAAQGLPGRGPLQARVRALDDPDAMIRKYAAYGLRQLGDPEFTETLIAHFTDEDDSIRHSLVWALSAIGNDAVEPLIAALKHENWRIRGGAAQALKLYNVQKVDPRPLEHLIESTTDERAEVRAAAVETIAHRYLRVAREPAEVLDVFVARLDDDETIVRTQASRALQQATNWWPDRRAVPHLIRRLESDDASERELSAVIDALGQYKDPRAVKPLLNLADNETLHTSVIRALAELGDRRAIDVLRAELESRDTNVIRALGKMGDRESLPQIIDFLSDKDSQVRLAAAEALQHMPAESATEKLVMQLRAAWTQGNRRGEYRGYADAIAATFDPQAIRVLIDILDQPQWNDDRGEWPPTETATAPPSPSDFERTLVQHEFYWPLFNAGIVALPALADGLDSKNRTKRELCAAVFDNLASQGDVVDAAFEPYVPRLIEHLTDESIAVRRCCAQALGWIKSKPAVPALIALARKPLPETTAQSLIPGSEPPAVSADFIRRDALRALSYIGSADAFAVFRETIENGTEAQVAIAVRNIGGIPHDDVVDLLITALRNDSAGVSHAASRVIGFQNDPRAVVPLIGYVKRTPIESADQSALSLGMLGDEAAVDVLKPLLAAESFEVQLSAAVALAQLNDASGLPLLREWFNSRDSRRREQVAYRLSLIAMWSDNHPQRLIRSEPVLEFIREQLKSHHDGRVRMRMASALGGQKDTASIAVLKSVGDDVYSCVPAARALLKVDPESARTLLRAMIDRTDTDKNSAYSQSQALSLLVVDAEVEDIARVVGKLRSPHENVRLAAVLALARHQPDIATEHLKSLATEDPTPRIRARARAELGRLSGTAP